MLLRDLYNSGPRTITCAVLDHFGDLNASKVLQLMETETERRIRDFEAQHGSREALESEIQRVSTELERLARAVAAGGEIVELVKLMQQAQRRREELTAKLADFSGQSAEDLERWVLPLWEEFRQAFQRPPSGPRARQALRQILREPIAVSPVVDENGRLREWEYVGTGILDRVLAGRLKVAGVTKPYATELVPPG